MKVHAIYHWWAEEDDSAPCANLRSPVLMSIATLRGINKNIPITILDLSESQSNWLYFPEKLNFRVLRKHAAYEKHKDKIPGYKHLSRIEDINWMFRGAHLFDVLMYVDSDVFWFRDPLPLAGNSNRFCSNGWNTGYFYFNGFSTVSQEFISLLDVYTKAAIHSEDIRNLFKQHVGYDAWYGVWDEMTVSYIVHNHPELVDIIPKEEHMTIRHINQTNLDKVKMLHSNGTIMTNPFGKTGRNEGWGEQAHSRGLFLLLFKEFYDNATKVLDENDLKMMFTPQELDFYRSKQFSLLQNSEKVLATENSDGMFDIQKCLKP